MIIADANVWIDYFNLPASESGRILADLLEKDQVLLVGIVMAELYRGARTDDERDALSGTLDAVPYAEMKTAAWSRAGSIAQRLDASGRSLAMTDIIVAALAMELDHELFTRDEHFSRIPGLRLYQTPNGAP